MSLIARSLSLILIVLVAPSSAQTDVLKGLRKGHPRVMLTPASVEQLRTRVAEDADCRKIFARLKAKAVGVLHQDVCEYAIPDGVRLLSVARRVLDRVQLLGVVFLITGEEQYRERLWQEVQAAAAFRDWNTRHFLDTATLCRAFGLAYDWLFDEWSEAERAIIRNAMVKKALTPALKVLEEKRWWANGVNNWTQVCCGGVILGALAIADEEKAIAQRVVARGVEALRRGAVHYAPDGGWYEAPGYWHYATRYFVAALLGMESALGHDFGLSQAKGFLQTWRYPLHMVGPSERVFNYADCGLGRVVAWELFYFAERDGVEACADWQRRQALKRPSPLDLIFWRPKKGNDPWSKVPLDGRFEALDVVGMRSAWGDPAASYVGVKGGPNGRSHGQLDLGDFIFETDGVRWAVELGRENYNLPGYWSFGAKGRRWNYYRCRAEGNNTLIVNPGSGPDQDVRGKAEILRANLGGQNPSVVLDLSSALIKAKGRHQRGYWFEDRRGLLVVDELDLKQPSDAYWFVHTRAKVRLRDGGRVVRLTQGRKASVFEIVAPSEARWSVGPAAPLESSPNPQGINANKGYHRLTIRLSGVQKSRIVVWMGLPGHTAPKERAEVPLSKW